MTQYSREKESMEIREILDEMDHVRRRRQEISEMFFRTRMYDDEENIEFENLDRIPDHDF